MNSVLAGSQWLRRSSSSNKAKASRLHDSRSGPPSTEPTSPHAAATLKTSAASSPAPDEPVFDGPLWPTYEPPIVQIDTHWSPSAISDAASSTNNWTLDLGLSSPSRARKTSPHSNGRGQLLSNATDHAGTSLLSLVDEVQPDTPYSKGSKRRSITRRTSKESSAGGSNFSHAHDFEENESHEFPLRNETPHSHHTFGGSSKSGGPNVVRKHGTSRAIDTSGHGRRSSSPSIVAPSSQYASVDSSRSEAESLPAGSSERVLRIDSVASELSAGLLTVATRSSRAPSGRADTFDAGSFEWRIAEALLNSPRSRSSRASRPKADSAVSSSEAHSPLRSEHDSTPKIPDERTQRLPGEKNCPPRVESMPNSNALNSSGPSRGRHRHHSLPARASRARARSEGPPRVRVRACAPLDMFGSPQDHSDPFQERNRHQAPDERLWAVYPSSRAALGYSSSATLLCARESTHSILTFITASPRLSSTFLIETSNNGQDPFTDASSSSSTVHLPWPEIGELGHKTAHEQFEEEPVWIPLPIRPVHKSLPSSHRPSSANFLTASPRELRRSWRQEQREQRRQSAHESRREQPLDVPSTLHEVWATAEQPSCFMQESESLEEGGISSMCEFEMTPSLQSSRVGWISRSISFGRLALVPLGGWYFVFGFICPPLWWIGAFYPRRAAPLTGSRFATLSNNPGGPISQWPDTRAGARRPLHDPSSRGGWLSGRISRWIEGADTNSLLQRRAKSCRSSSSRGIEGGPVAIARVAAMEREAAPWQWRRRNRVMSLISAPILFAIVAATIWACVSSAFIPS